MNRTHTARSGDAMMAAIVAAPQGKRRNENSRGTAVIALPHIDLSMRELRVQSIYTYLWVAEVCR